MSASHRRGLPGALLVGLSCLLVVGSLPAEAGEEPSLEPFARQVLERMSGFLGSAERLTFDAVTETVDVAADGLPVRLRTEARVAIRRPDRLFVDIVSDEVHRRITLNGQRLRLQDLVANMYARAEAPGGIDETLGLLEERLGVFVPLGQLLRRDPLSEVMEGVTVLSYVGLDEVGGVPCHHVAARQAELVWEAWIEEGRQPVPRKLVFHFDDDEGTTTYTALVTAWGFPADLPDEGFAAPLAETALEVPLREVPGGEK